MGREEEVQSTKSISKKPVLKKRGPMKKAAFVRAILKYTEDLNKYALHLTKSHAVAEDLVQDTFVRALSKYRLFEAGTSIQPWLFAVMRNLYIDGHRREEVRVRCEASASEWMLSYENVFFLEDREKFSLVAPFLMCLSQEERDAVVGRDYLDLSHHELTEILSIPISALKSKVSRAANKIRQKLSNAPSQFVDLSAWKTATRDPGHTHPKIAKAYEEMYAKVRESLPLSAIDIGGIKVLQTDRVLLVLKFEP